MKIVIIDDSEMVRTSLTDILQTSGCYKIVGHASNISDGLNVILETKPDLAILDINMPGGSGISLLEHIKKNNLVSKVIMWTNYADDNFHALCMRMGADYFLDKSRDYDKLLSVIGEEYTKTLTIPNSQ